MNTYEKSNYEFSISCLAMLKRFHDYGVDVKRFSVESFMVDLNYNMSSPFDIFQEGLDAMFEEVEGFEYGENIELYAELSEGSEYGFIVKDQLLSQVFHGKYGKELVDFITKLNPESYCECDIKVLPTKDGIAILIYFFGELHELTYCIIKMMERAKELKKKMEDKQNGVFDSANRQIA